MTDGHLIHGNAQLFRRNLREYGFVPLAVRAGTGEHRDRAGAFHAHGAAFKTGAAARLHKGRDAHAHQFAARTALVALANQLFIIGQLQRRRERFLVVAGVVLDAHRRFGRETARAE